jgi:hypothetical protein
VPRSYRELGGGVPEATPGTGEEGAQTMPGRGDEVAGTTADKVSSDIYLALQTDGPLTLQVVPPSSDQDIYLDFRPRNPPRGRRELGGGGAGNGRGPPGTAPGAP